MVRTNKSWAYLYLSLYLPFIYTGGELNTFLAVSAKVLPICFLAYICCITLKVSISRVIGFALLFSALGDATLETEHGLSFPIGILAFLIAQLIYAWQFWKLRSENINRLPFILLGFFAFGMLYLLYPVTGNLMPAIVIYLIAICAMVAGALVYNGSTWVKIGALCFLISDSCIAINKFLHPIDHSGLIIMSTYYLAQLLLCSGLTIDHSETRPQNPHKTT